MPDTSREFWQKIEARVRRPYLEQLEASIKQDAAKSQGESMSDPVGRGKAYVREQSQQFAKPLPQKPNLCPNCGVRACWVQVRDFDHHVFCSGCRMSGPEKGTREEAIAVWNRLTLKE